MSTEQEALRLADLLMRDVGDQLVNRKQAAAMLRKLVAEREEYRAAMRRALDSHVEISRLEWDGLDWAKVSAAAITDLRRVLGDTT